MKYIFLLILPFLLSSCDNQTQKANQNTEEQTTILNDAEGNYGIVMSNGEAQNASQLTELLSDKTSTEIKLIGEIESVCQMSGCWMDIRIGNGEIVHVTFENDAFVMPNDIAGKTAIIEGVATKEIISVEYLKRQAESEGKTQAEIDAITEPLTEYSFVASGVKLEE